MRWRASIAARATTPVSAAAFVGVYEPDAAAAFPSVDRAAKGDRLIVPHPEQAAGGGQDSAQTDCRYAASDARSGRCLGRHRRSTARANAAVPPAGSAQSATQRRDDGGAE